MNSMPDMTPVNPQTQMSDSSFQDKSSPDKSEFASLVKKECSKSIHCKSDQKEIKSDSVMEESDGSGGGRPACNDCTTDIKNTMHNTSGNNVQQTHDDIKTMNSDDEHSYDEAGLGKDLKTGALLFSLVQSYMSDIEAASPVSIGDGATKSPDIGAAGAVSESASGDGLEVGALLNDLITNYTEENKEGINPASDSDQTTLVNGAVSSESPAGNGMKVGALLNNLINQYAAKIEEASDSNYENAANVDIKGPESVGTSADSHSDNGLKIGELLNRLTDRSDQKEINNDLIREEMASVEKKIDVNAKADDSEADSLIFKKEIPTQSETRKEATGHVEKYYADEKTSAMDMPDNNDSSEGLNGRPVSVSSYQFSHEKGTEENAFNFAKGPHTSGNDVETNNINSINTSNTTVENAKSIQSPSVYHTAKTPGAQELLDNVVYVIKGNSKMGVSIENESLGKLNISLSLEKGLVNVHINTSDQAVREILDNNIQHIIDSLNKDGVSVGEFSVGLREQRDHETTRYSFKNGQGREIPLETKKENRHSGLVNIFA